MSVTKFHSEADKFMKRLSDKAASEGRQVTCRQGCFHCCLEPMYSDLSEAVEIVSSIPNEEREGLFQRTQSWIVGFESQRFYEMETEPTGYGPLLKYRSARLRCPLLVNGLCIAYDKRPFGCRTHVAVGSPSRCAEDGKRPKQAFLKTDKEVMNSLAFHLVEDMPKALVQFDHLGIWLAEIQGIKTPKTKARKTMVLNFG